nr:hypothetical protein [Escherichia coli]
MTGIDSSPAMVAEARSALPDCQFVEADIRNWQPEHYKDEDAVAFHKTTPHYKTCVAKLESLMTGPRKKRLFNGLMP